MVIYMKRSIVKHGPSTLTISIPSSWAKKNNLKPGITLDVEEKGSQLLISTKKQDEFIKIEVDIKNNYKSGIRYINSLHRKGCDELYLKYDDPAYLKRIEQCLSEDILGFEIVKQDKNSCLIQDVTGTKAEEFDVLISRIWVILISISEDVLKAIREDSKSSLENIMSLDKRINKFTNFCIRILNKRGHINYKNIPVYYRLLRGLEELSDFYKYLLFYYCKNNMKVSKNFLDLLEETNDYLKEFNRCFYKPRDEEIEKLLAETKTMYNKISEHCKKSREEILVVYLFAINDKIRSLISSIIELNLLKN